MRKSLTVCSWVFEVNTELLTFQYFLTLVTLDMGMLFWGSFGIILLKLNVHRHENLMYRKELHGLKYQENLGFVSE